MAMACLLHATRDDQTGVFVMLELELRRCNALVFCISFHILFIHARFFCVNFLLLKSFLVLIHVSLVTKSAGQFV